ncbi:MAG: class I SAM-dependent methyltransferase, partial [Chloroflexi bacterium]|nr:class I SAM-dependent methyltransferase [Chloroflexota bacterium]
MDAKEIVRRGYDAISYNYRTDDGRNMPSDYAGWLAELTPLLPKEAAILELGCGCGV